MKKMLLGLLCVLIVGVNGLRFYRLNEVPHGYHVDEYASAVVNRCMATQGTGPWGQERPVFVNVGYGTPKPPVYVWPLLLWTKVFDDTTASVRAFSVTVVIVGIIGIFFFARRVGGTGCGLWAMAAASMSPWMWSQGRVGYESLVAPMFLVWGLFFLWRRQAWWDAALAGLMMCCAMYGYPPARMFIPMLLVVVFGLSRGWGVKPSMVFIFLGSFFIPMIPLIQGVLDGSLQGRFNEISIASGAYLRSIGATPSVFSVAREFIHNYLLHLSPSFLFFHGDPSYVHSTRHFGLFSWLDYLAWGAFVVLLCSQPKKLLARRPELLLCVIGFFLALVPSSMTNSEIPNQLRICLGWPLVSVFTGIVLGFYCEAYVKVQWLALVAAGIFSYQLVNVYFNVYPEESKGMFSFWVKEQASQLKTDEDWLKFMVLNHKLDYHIRYYLMRLKNQSCAESFQTWKAIGEIMDKAHLR